jgi:HicB family
MNLRDVPDDVSAELVEAAAENRQSLNAYVVDRLTELAQLARVREYVTSYTPPAVSRVTLEDAVAAVREVREASGAWPSSTPRC